MIVVVPKIVMVALLVVVLFSTTTSSTSQWGCAYGVGFYLGPVDKTLIFTLVVSCLLNSVLSLWARKATWQKIALSSCKTLSSIPTFTVYSHHSKNISDHSQHLPRIRGNTSKIVLPCLYNSYLYVYISRQNLSLISSHHHHLL